MTVMDSRRRRSCGLFGFSKKSLYALSFKVYCMILMEIPVSVFKGRFRASMKLATSGEMCIGNGMLSQSTVPSRIFSTIGPSSSRPTAADKGPLAKTK